MNALNIYNGVTQCNATLHLFRVQRCVKYLTGPFGDFEKRRQNTTVARCSTPCPTDIIAFWSHFAAYGLIWRGTALHLILIRTFLEDLSKHGPRVRDCCRHRTFSNPVLFDFVANHQALGASSLPHNALTGAADTFGDLGITAQSGLWVAFSSERNSQPWRTQKGLAPHHHRHPRVIPRCAPCQATRAGRSASPSAVVVGMARRFIAEMQRGIVGPRRVRRAS